MFTLHTMNLLAHAYLGRDLSMESNAFNVLWDFVSRDYLQDSREVVLQGRYRHLAIDRLANEQAWFARSRKLISRERRKAAPVLVDIFCDYLLIQEWGQIASLGSEHLIEHFMPNLFQGARPEGAPLLRMARIIRDQHWLDDYRTINGLGRVFSRISRRSSPRLAAMLMGAEEELQNLESQFLSGFPDFIKNLDRQIRTQKTVKSGLLD